MDVGGGGPDVLGARYVGDGWVLIFRRIRGNYDGVPLCGSCVCLQLLLHFVTRKRLDCVGYCKSSRLVS